jgi:SAM-dependent methyltransferase
MSHPAQMIFVESVKQNYVNLFIRKKVLEVGSLNINGSIRQFFIDCDYTGVDLAPGKDVDMVARGEDLSFPDKNFDVVCSCECFEHNPEWARTFDNMARMAKSLVFFSCATTGRPEHGTPRTTPQDAPFCGDYYQNLKASDFLENCNMDAFISYRFLVNKAAQDLYFIGIKKP